jgi:PAS domain S-box-containing protein
VIAVTGLNLFVDQQMAILAFVLVVIIPGAWWFSGIITRQTVTRRELEAQITGKTQELSDIIDGLPVLISKIGADYRYHFANRTAEQWFGMKRADVVGKTVSEIFGQETLDKALPHITKVLGGEVDRWSDTIVYPNGIERNVDITYQPNFNADGEVIGFFSLILDVTSQRKAEQTLREQEMRFEAFLESSPSAILIRDVDGHHIAANQKWHDWFNPEGKDLIGSTIFEQKAEKHIDHVHDIDVKVASTGETYSWEVETDFFDGTGRSILVQKFPIRGPSGEIIAIGSVNTDISHSKEVELELIKAKETAEYADRAKSEFLANMSHELRTPLNAILGFSEIIENLTFGREAVERYKDYAADIHNSGRHLLELLSDILDLSKIEAGAMEVFTEQLNVRVLIEKSLRLLGDRAEHARIRLKIDCADNLPDLTGDERMLKQIFVNLISNAIKFTEAGGVVTVGARHNENSGVTLFVSDNGIGIAEDQVDKALSVFGQVDGSMERKFQGTGLGLPLVRSLAELHGGHLEIESEIGVGTTVRVIFPGSSVFAA